MGRVDEPPAPEAGRGDEREVLAVDEMDARQVEPAVTAEPAEDLGEGPTEELEEWSAATLEEPAATSEAAEDVATWAGVAPLPIPEHDPLNDPLVVQPSAAEERPVPTSAASALDEQPAAEPAHEEQYEEQSTHEQRPAAEESDLPTEVFHVPSEWEQPEEPAHEQPVEPAWGQHAAQEPVWGQHAAREPVGTHEPLAPEPVWGQPQPPEESVWGQPLSAEVPQWGEPGPEQATSVTARPVARLQFAHGDVVDVDCAILIGRAPEARRFSSTDQPRLVTVPSPNQEISSTHLEVRPGAGVDHGTAVVTDMGSTNGTVLVQPGGGPEDLEPGVPVPLVPGAIIDLGDGMTIQVLHA